MERSRTRNSNVLVLTKTISTSTASLKINEKVEKVNKLTLNPVLYVNGMVQSEYARTKSVHGCTPNPSGLDLNVHLCCVTLVTGEDAAANTYKDLRKLSRVFKDKMAYPVIAAAREGIRVEQYVCIKKD